MEFNRGNLTPWVANMIATPRSNAVPVAPIFEPSSTIFIERFAPLKPRTHIVEEDDESNDSENDEQEAHFKSSTFPERNPTVELSNLPYQQSSNDITSVVRSFLQENLLSPDLVHQVGIIYNEAELPSGKALVTLTDKEAALVIFNALHGYLMDGRTIRTHMEGMTHKSNHARDDRYWNFGLKEIVSSSLKCYTCGCAGHLARNCGFVPKCVYCLKCHQKEELIPEPFQKIRKRKHSQLVDSKYDYLLTEDCFKADIAPSSLPWTDIEKFEKLRNGHLCPSVPYYRERSLLHSFLDPCLNSLSPINAHCITCRCKGHYYCSPDSDNSEEEDIDNDIDNDDVGVEDVMCFYCGESGHSGDNCSRNKEYYLSELGRTSKWAARQRHAADRSPQHDGKFLVLLDMNGTLLLRKVAERGDPAGEFMVKSKSYYMRHSSLKLVRALMDHPKVSFAFYTSMSEGNAFPAVNYLTHGNSVPIYDRDYNKPDLDASNEWDTMRDLPKVWGAHDTPAFGFDEKRTIMIDDTDRKMREYPNNVLIVPVLGTVEQRHDDSLVALLSYLLGLIKAQPADVREYIQANPFDHEASRVAPPLPPPLQRGLSSRSENGHTDRGGGYNRNQNSDQSVGYNNQRQSSGNEYSDQGGRYNRSQYYDQSGGYNNQWFQRQSYDRGGGYNRNQNSDQSVGYNNQRQSSGNEYSDQGGRYNRSQYYDQSGGYNNQWFQRQSYDQGGGYNGSQYYDQSGGYNSQVLQSPWPRNGYSDRGGGYNRNLYSDQGYNGQNLPWQKS